MKVFMEGGCPLVAEPEINERTCQKNDSPTFSVIVQSREWGKNCVKMYTEALEFVIKKINIKIVKKD